MEYGQMNNLLAILVGILVVAAGCTAAYFSEKKIFKKNKRPS